MLGSMIGNYAGKALASGIASAMSGAGFMAAITNPWTAIPAILITGITAAVAFSKKKQEEQLKEAEEAFKELEEKYNAAKGSNTTAKQFDELAKGVDSLGRNVSLTEEKYQEFLDKSNGLAELFPELVVRTDRECNRLVGLGNIVGGVTDKVAELNNELEKDTDDALLDKDLYYKNLKSVQEQIAEVRLDADKLWEDLTSDKTSSVDRRKAFETIGIETQEYNGSNGVVVTPNATYEQIKKAYEAKIYGVD